jgi:hypothetical protein
LWFHARTDLAAGERDAASFQATTWFIVVGLITVGFLFRRFTRQAKAILSVLFVLSIGLLLIRESRRGRLVQQAIAAAERLAGPAHTATRLEGDGLAAYAVQEPAHLHYVFFSQPVFTRASTSGGSNKATRVWTDEGSIILKNGGTFGFRRESVHPDTLKVNGAEYDLTKGPRISSSV